MLHSPTRHLKQLRNSRFRPLQLLIAAISILCGEVSGSEGYRLAFADEFDLGALDTTRWTTTMASIGRSGSRYLNDSSLSYATEEYVILEDAKVRLRAHRREISSSDPVENFGLTQGFISAHGQYA